MPPERSVWARYLEAGMAFTDLTRSRAEAFVRELVKAGEVQRERTQDAVDELVERSRKSTEALVSLIRREIRQQLSALGLTTKPPARKGATKKAPAKKAPAKKAPAKKTVKKAPAKKTPVKKTATKSPGKKTAAKKTAASKSGA